VDLFVERAQIVAPSFSVIDTDEAAAVVEICRRLDGIPLAIELAASRMASMTASEVRDRLDDRFRLLVRSRRGLERHHTLRQAVAWSYDLLDEPEQALLQRCSVFAGGFDLQSACAVAGRDTRDDYAVLDLVDALVHKSLVVADRSGGRTRFSMLETIRQFAEERLVADGAATEVRAAHARHFAAREADILALWDSPRQREAYDWFTVELANLRAAFRWAADQNDLDTAAAIASYAAFLGIWGLEQYEPIAWAEELIEPAKAVEHRRLAQLYVMAAQCAVEGRTDEAVGYAEASRMAIESGRFDQVPYEAETWVAGGYISNGQPERWVESCRNIIAREPGPHTLARAGLVLAFNVVGAGEDARVAAEGLLAAADSTDNPQVCCFALLAYGIAQRGADPVAAHDVLRRGLELAQRSGNRFAEAQLAASLSRLVATHGAPVDAFDYLALAIRHYLDAGSFAPLGSPLVILAGVFARTGRHEPAAMIVGFAANPWTLRANPEINTTIAHLRDVLGGEVYDSLARAGESMTAATIATYALEQIDQARTELNGLSK